MDFFERLFGLSPDGGDGSLELLLFAVPVAGLALIYTLKPALRRRWLRRQKD